jgi:hypothetical protein
VWRSLAVAVLLLAGCADEGPPQPLTSLDIRSRVFGHLMEARQGDRAPYLIRFEHADRAEIYGETREFARWYADDRLGLCLQRYRAPPVCAPFYQLNVSHFRWGKTTLSDLTIRRPHLDFDHDRDRPFLFPTH